MQRLTVLYDARCRLCRRVRAWLEAQPKFVELEFIPAASGVARQRYPCLDHAASLRDLVVVGDGGEVYQGAKAWLMCLWALRDYREWSMRLASPALMPLAREIVATVSRHRLRFGRAEAWQEELDCELCLPFEPPPDAPAT